MDFKFLSIRSVGLAWRWYPGLLEWWIPWNWVISAIILLTNSVPLSVWITLGFSYREILRSPRAASTILALDVRRALHSNPRLHKPWQLCENCTKAVTTCVCRTNGTSKSERAKTWAVVSACLIAAKAASWSSAHYQTRSFLKSLV